MRFLLIILILFSFDLSLGVAGEDEDLLDSFLQDLGESTAPRIKASREESSLLDDFLNDDLQEKVVRTPPRTLSKKRKKDLGHSAQKKYTKTRLRHGKVSYYDEEEKRWVVKGSYKPTYVKTKVGKIPKGLREAFQRAEKLLPLRGTSAGSADFSDSIVKKESKKKAKKTQSKKSKEDDYSSEADDYQ